MVNLGEDTLTIIVNYYSQCKGVSSFKNATFKVQTTRLTPISYAISKSNLIQCGQHFNREWKFLSPHDKCQSCFEICKFG